MRFVFFTNTPAHVHLYKHAVNRLVEAGHEVLVLGRDYGCTVALLERYELPYQIYGACGTTKGSVFRNLPWHYARIVPAVLSFDPDMIFGVGAYAAHAGLVSRTPAVLVLDSEPTSFDHAISRPFAAAFLTPHAFQKHLGTNHYQFRGFCETAYLHPDVYQPNPNIRTELELEADEPFVVLRFNAFGSHHDVGQSGFTRSSGAGWSRRSPNTPQSSFPTREGPWISARSRLDRSTCIPHCSTTRWRRHGSSSPTHRRSVLRPPCSGRPSSGRTRSWGRRHGELPGFEAQNLVVNTDDFDEVIATGLGVLSDDSIGTEWRRRRDEYVGGLVNLTDVIVSWAESGGPEDVPSLEKWRANTERPTSDRSVPIAGESS